MPKITVHNSDTGEEKEFKVGYGANLRKGAVFNDVVLYKGMAAQLNCRGMGMCGTCLIEVEPLENVNGHSLIEKLHRLGPNQKLGCRAKVYGDITIKAALKDL
jgi:ferredoxin